MPTPKRSAFLLPSLPVAALVSACFGSRGRGGGSCTVHRRVGSFEQAGEGGSSGSGDGRPHTCRDRDHSLASEDGHVADRCGGSGSEYLYLMSADGHEYGEFVATEAGYTAFLGRASSEQVGEMLENQVAGGVSEAIVDLLEVIEVNDQQRKLLVRGRCRFGELRETAAETASVEAASEIVATSEFLELCPRLRVCKRKSHRICEPAGQLELVVAEASTVALAVQAQRPKNLIARNEG